MVFWEDIPIKTVDVLGGVILFDTLGVTTTAVVSIEGMSVLNLGPGLRNWLYFFNMLSLG